jgi:dTDP-4-amino-4,6-dideoxygalactose transaminase
MRGGALGRVLREALRRVGRGAFQATALERIPTGTQHFEREQAGLGMSAFARRIALAQDFSTVIERRRRNFFLLLSHLRDVAPPVFGELPSGVCPLFYPLRVADKSTVMARLAAQGVESIDFWRHGHPSCSPSEFPDSEILRRTILEIPIHQDLTPSAMVWVAEAVRGAMRRRI